MSIVAMHNYFRESVWVYVGTIHHRSHSSYKTDGGTIQLRNKDKVVSEALLWAI